MKNFLICDEVVIGDFFNQFRSDVQSQFLLRKKMFENIVFGKGRK